MGKPEIDDEISQKIRILVSKRDEALITPKEFDREVELLMRERRKKLNDIMKVALETTSN